MSALGFIMVHKVLAYYKAINGGEKLESNKVAQRERSAYWV
jgi:hypothetical protein